MLNTRSFLLRVCLLTLFSVGAACGQTNNANTNTNGGTNIAGNGGGGLTGTTNTGPDITTSTVGSNRSIGSGDDLQGYFDNVQSVFGPAASSNSNGPARSFSFGNFTGNSNISAGGTSRTSRQVRPRFRISFPRSATLTNPALIRNRLSGRLNSASKRSTALRGVRVGGLVEGRVVLSGQVGSRYSRLLAANLMRLEPGVRSVRNDITVASQPPAPTRTSRSPGALDSTAPRAPTPPATPAR